MTLTRLSLRGLQPDIFPAYATEPLTVCAVNANRYNHNSYMAAFSAPFFCPLFLPDVVPTRCSEGQAWTVRSVYGLNSSELSVPDSFFPVGRICGKLPSGSFAPLALSKSAMSPL
jgi:hypothetical protein